MQLGMITLELSPCLLETFNGPTVSKSIDMG